MTLETDINLGAITEALNNKVDRDADNLSTAGQKVFDGQWVLLPFVSIGTEITVGTYSHSLSSILPNDGYNYECIIMGDAKFLGNSAVSIGSDLVNPNFSLYQLNQNGGYQRNTIVIPVGTGRTINVQIDGTDMSVNSVSIRGYRRIGTNS